MFGVHGALTRRALRRRRRRLAPIAAALARHCSTERPSAVSALSTRPQRRRDLAEHALDLDESVAVRRQTERGGDSLGRRDRPRREATSACAASAAASSARTIARSRAAAETPARATASLTVAGDGSDSRRATAWPIHVSRRASSRSVSARVVSAAASASCGGGPLPLERRPAGGDADVLGGGFGVPPAQHPGAERTVDRDDGAVVPGVVDRHRGEHAFHRRRVDRRRRAAR